MTNSRPLPVFVAALPREIAPLVKAHGLRAEPDLLAKGIHLYRHSEVVFVCAGMGAARAVRAVEAALAMGPVSQLISIGWAGACNDQYKAGEIVRANVVVDVKTGERFFTGETREGRRGQQVVVTVDRPAGIAEKTRLSLSYYAAAVDMEAAAVARIARARELPFFAIKAISDAVDLELPDMAAFTGPQGQFREAAFGLHVALRPRLWKPVATLARGSTLAAQRLREEVEAHIQNSLEERERAQ